MERNATAELLTVSDVAALCDVAAVTVRGWAAAGKIPTERTAGGVRLFRRADVERMAGDRLERQRERAVSAGGRRQPIAATV